MTFAERLCGLNPPAVKSPIESVESVEKLDFSHHGSGLSGLWANKKSQEKEQN